MRIFPNAAILACVLAVASRSQDPPAFRSKVEVVALPCTVVDASGIAVQDLTREEFRVFDNGIRRPVESLWRDADLPVTLGVLIDASESQREQLAEHRETALQVVDRILHPGDRVFVVSVEQEVRLWADLAAPGRLRERITENRGAPFAQPCPQNQDCGSSPLWNAIYAAAQKLRPISGSKAILILTDGFDSGSTHSLSDAIGEAQRADAGVYAIQYPSGLGGSYAPALYRLVGETGGTWFRPPGNQYGPIVSRMDTDLRRHYVLGFRPETMSFGKERHEVRVEVTRPDLNVRARRTYFQPRSGP